MADSTLNVILKLTTNQFQTGMQSSQRAVAGLGQAMMQAIQRGADPLGARLTAAASATRAYNAALQAGATATDAETRAAQAAAQALDQMAQSTAKATRATQQGAQTTKSFTENMADVYNGLMGVKEGYEFVAGAVQGYLDIGERAAQRSRTAQMFENLSGGANAARANLNAMRQATNYTLSETEALTQAVSLLGLNLADTPQELGAITQQVTRLGQQFGGLASGQAIQAFSQISLTQATDGLRVFGLTATDVQSRLEKFTAAGMDAQSAFQAAFLEALDEKFKAVGGGAQDAATAFDQYHAAVADLGAVLEDGLLPYATRAVEALRDLATLASGGFVARANLMVESGLQGAESPEAFAAKVSQAFNKALSVPGSLGLGPDLAGVREAILNTATTQEEYNAGMAEYNRLLQENSLLVAAQTALQEGMTGGLGGAVASLFEYGKASTDGARAQQALGDAAEWSARQSQQASQIAAQAAQDEAAALANLETAHVKLREVEAKMAAKALDARIDAAQQAADAERRAAQRAEDQAIAAARRAEDQARNTAQRRSQIAAQYAQAQAQAAATRAKSIEQARLAHGQRLADIEKTHQQRVADIQRQYAKSVAEAEISRDAEALWRAAQTRDEELAAAKRDRDDQQQTAHGDYAAQLEAAQQTYVEQQAAAQQAQAQALADLQENLAEQAAAQALADQRRLADEQLASSREQEARAAQLQARLGQITAEFDAEYQAALAHYNRMAQLANAPKRKSSEKTQNSSSGSAKRKGGLASGGYADYGLYPLGEAGREFVLNADTTRRLEGAVGSLNQSKLANLGGINISPVFNGVNAGDQLWIRQELTRLASEINAVPRRLQEALDDNAI